jgi:hypothetical protein
MEESDGLAIKLLSLRLSQNETSAVKSIKS